MQAGMGGGSADAAAMLHARNRLDGERFSTAELARIGAAVGADVPFCTVGGTALCRGIGEEIEPIENHLKASFLVAIGEESVSTPAAFGALDRLHGAYRDFVPTHDVGTVVNALQGGDAALLSAGAYNAFEEVICPACPSVERIKRIMRENGAALAQMSGSGPSVFGVFSDTVSAQNAKKALDGAGYRAFLCE
jgi:4-diphosphocytidyl-2-C-methyl-D-erythritol kinase